MAQTHRHSLLASGAVFISLAALAPGASVLGELRFYEYPPNLRAVLDFDQLAPVEISAEMIAGRLTVEAADAVIGADFQTRPVAQDPRVEIVRRGGDGSPVVLRISTGHPLVSTDQFVLRQVGDVVLTLERESALLPPAPVGALVVQEVSPEDDAPASALPLLNLPPIPVSSSLVAADVSPELADTPPVISSLPASPAPPEDQINPLALGPDALADDFETTPVRLESLPRGVEADYQAAVQDGDRRAALAAINRWMREHPNEPRVETMVYLAAEQEHWIAREEGDAADWPGVIDNFRYALRLFPRSEWAPLAWMRIFEAQRRMGWDLEAIATLERFQRAATPYSLGKIIDLRASVLAELNRAEDEIAARTELVEKDPEYPGAAQSLLRLGHLLHARGDRIRSYDAFRRSWERDRRLLLADADLLGEAAACALENNDQEWAQTLVDRLLTDFPARPDNARVMALQARLRRAQGRDGEALEIYEQMLRTYGETPQTLEAIVRLAMQGEADAEAGRLAPNVTDRAYHDPRDAYERVIRQFPSEEVAQIAFQRLGRALIANGEPEEALLVLDQMIRTHPRSPLRLDAEEMMNQALAQAISGHIDAGDAMSAVALHCESQGMQATFDLSPALQWRLAQAYAELGLREQAAAFTERLLDQWGRGAEPDLPWESVLHSHIASLRQTDRLGEALAAVDRWLSQFPQSPRRADLAYARADVLHALGRWHSCLGAIDEALALGGTADQRLEAHFLRADCTRHALGPELALPIYVEALQTFQREGRDHLTSAVPFEIVFGLADCLHQTANWDRARRVYEELIAVYPDAPERPIFDYRLAQCLAHLGRGEEARQHLGTLLTRDAGTIWGELARQMRTDVEWTRRYPSVFTPGGVTP